MGNCYTQVYITPFHWVAVYPTETKADAHHSLDTLFHRDGVPHVIFPGNAKELTTGHFKKKAL